jgi:acyloxyacyl hydrolase
LPWEEALCAQTPSRGILAIGDSATAHFSLPPSYITPSDFNMSTYAGIIQEVLTEADWPHCSWSTAWANNTVWFVEATRMHTVRHHMHWSD